MAKDRLTVCKYYESFGVCKKGRTAEMKGYCQHCNKYEPRVRERHLNVKKQKLENMRKKYD